MHTTATIHEIDMEAWVPRTYSRDSQPWVVPRKKFKSYGAAENSVLYDVSEIHREDQRYLLKNLPRLQSVECEKKALEPEAEELHCIISSASVPKVEKPADVASTMLTDTQNFCVRNSSSTL